MLKPRAPYVVAHWSLLVEEFDTSALSFYQAVEEAVRGREVPDVEFSRVLWKEGGVASADREYLRVQRGRLAFDVCAAPFGRGYFFSSWLARQPFGHALAWLGLFIALAITGAFVFFILLGFSTRITGDVGAPCGLLVIGVPTILVFVPAGLWLLGLAIHQGHIFDEELVVSIPWVGPLYSWIFNPNAYFRIDTALMFQKIVHNAVTEVIDSLRTEQGLQALSEVERKPTIREFMR